MTCETSLPPVVPPTEQELVEAASWLEGNAQRETDGTFWTDRALATFLRTDRERVAAACARVQGTMPNMCKHFAFFPPQSEEEQPKKETRRMRIDRQNGQGFIFSMNEDYTLMNAQGAYLVLMDLQNNTVASDEIQRNLEAGIVYFRAPQKDKQTLRSYAVMRARQLSDQRLSDERKEFNGVMSSRIGNYQQTILSKGYQAFTDIFNYREKLGMEKDDKPTEYMPVRAIEAIRVATAKTITWARQTEHVAFWNFRNEYCKNMRQARADIRMDNSEFYDVPLRKTHQNLMKASKEYWKGLALPKRVITRQKAKPNNRKENNGQG